MSADFPDRWAQEAFCYLTTHGRKTGLPRTIEIWFAAQAGHLYLLAEHGDRANWVRNIRADPAVRVQLGSETRTGLARLVLDPAEDRLARQSIAAKYEDWQVGEPLPPWVLRALPVAIEFPRNPR